VKEARVRFVMFYRPSNPDAEAGLPPKPEYQARMSSFIADAFKSGVLIATDGLKPSSQGARVKLNSRKYTVMDGPFSEAKEVIAGYAVMHYASKKEAVEAAKLFLEVAGDGECEIRPLYEAADFGPPTETGPGHAQG
jgi:hypothetical protein